MSLLQIYEPGQTPLPHERHIAVGIDLGTTHSAVAVGLPDGRGAMVIGNPDGQKLLPSAVYYGDNGLIEVGSAARARYEQGERDAVVSIKRLMGRGGRDIKPLLGTMPYQLADDGESGDMVRLQLGKHAVTPVEISAEILKKLKNIAENALSDHVSQAVITVPAYFDDAARTATRDAARLAGLEVLRLINEPTAAALAYGLDKGVEGHYAVYDLGGGTFDFSLLKLEHGVFQVLSTAGDTLLGGDDFDQAIAAWVLSEAGERKEEPERGEVSMLIARARTAKHALSDQPDTVIDYKDRPFVLTRDVFESLIIPYVSKTLEVCEQALLSANFALADIKGVIMVGGSTRVRLVQQQVEHYFGKAPLNDVNPDEVVAIGAALQAQMLTDAQESDHLLIDVIPLSIGLETMGGLSEKILYRNTPIPVSVAQEFTTYQDGQDGMQIHVVQGERELVAHNRSLARFELNNIPRLPAGIARVNVVFTVDADGLLTVSAEEKTTGVRQDIQVKPSYGLPPEQIEQMLLESMVHAKDDITERLLVEARVDAGRAIAELESAMAQDGDILSEPERKRIERQIRVLHTAIDGSDRQYIDAELQELGRIGQDFAERRMDKAIGSALKGAHIDKIMNS